jgi:molybdate transport system substrate-binding protein
VRFSVILSVVFLFWSTPTVAGNSLIAFVGSASMPATKEAALAFEKETGIHVELHFGGSGSMLSQVILSKRGDLYFPGSPDYLAKAIQKGAVISDSARKIAYLIPAINVPRLNPRSIEGLDDLAREGVRVGIGNPHSVCVGLYAVEILEKSPLREKIKANIRTYLESCSKTANIVALSNLDAVIGWRVFEHWNPKRIMTIPLKPKEIPRIAYLPIAVTPFSVNRRDAQRFIRFLESDAGKSIFRKWGYIVTEEEATRVVPLARIGGRYEIPSDW